jgi:hypothetical protein
MSKTNEPDPSPAAIDGINGRLNTADTEERGLTVGYAPLPHEFDYRTQNARVLKAMDEAKRKLKP